MAGLGLMNRRRAIQASPSGENILDDIVFYDGLQSDGYSYLRIPQLEIGRHDTLEVEYSTSVARLGFLYGMRNPQRSVLCLLDSNKSMLFFAWFNNVVAEVRSDIDVHGSNKLLLTDVGYSTTAGAIMRRLYIDSRGQYVEVPGSYDDVMQQDFYIFNSDKTDGTIDNRGLLGSIHRFTIRSYDGLLKLDLRPCKYINEAGMFDMVSSQFFGNSGSGHFSLI